jgi:UDP-glucose 4-epimerase
MKIAVIGGSGFLGSHVCDQLSQAGHEVTIFDRVKSEWLIAKQKMIVGDLQDEKILAKAISGCEVVYNFAAIADIDEALNKPIETAKINVLGNVMLLEACRKAGIQRYIYASTLYVYSRDGGFYRCSKQSAEHYVEEYQRTYGLDYTILRYGSLYGPRSDNRNGLWRIVKNALDTGKVCYDGSPESMREYIHVEDAARDSITALGNEFLNQHVILTGQEQMKVIDLLKMLAEILGLPQDATKFIKSKHSGHYIRTPYAYQSKLGRKYVPPMHIDLGQGLIQLIDEVQNYQNER